MWLRTPQTYCHGPVGLLAGAPIPTASTFRFPMRKTMNRIWAALFADG